MHPLDADKVRAIVRINNGNVEVLKERFSGSWGSISLVYMEMAALARLVHRGIVVL